LLELREQLWLLVAKSYGIADKQMVVQFLAMHSKLLQSVLQVHSQDMKEPNSTPNMVQEPRKRSRHMSLIEDETAR
jgi:hypothetical protein